MARKPNYQFERMERDRAKAAKVAAKAAAKRQSREEAGEPSWSAWQAESRPTVSSVAVSDVRTRRMWDPPG